MTRKGLIALVESRTSRALIEIYTKYNAVTIWTTHDAEHVKYVVQKWAPATLVVQWKEFRWYHYLFLWRIKVKEWEGW